MQKHVKGVHSFCFCSLNMQNLQRLQLKILCKKYLTISFLGTEFSGAVSKVGQKKFKFTAVSVRIHCKI